jgi:hypothetical protein
MYDEQPELEITCDGNDPIEREAYQIFLNVWGNTKAFFEYWQTCPLSKPVRAEVPQQTTYEASLEAAWPRKRVHKRVLQLARLKAGVRQG